jgi:hypothetical protein
MNRTDGLRSGSTWGCFPILFFVLVAAGSASVLGVYPARWFLVVPAIVLAALCARVAGGNATSAECVVHGLSGAVILVCGLLLLGTERGTDVMEGFSYLAWIAGGLLVFTAVSMLIVTVQTLPPLRPTSQTDSTEPSNGPAAATGAPESAGAADAEVSSITESQSL